MASLRDFSASVYSFLSKWSLASATWYWGEGPAAGYVVRSWDRDISANCVCVCACVCVCVCVCVCIITHREWTN